MPSQERPRTKDQRGLHHTPSSFVQLVVAPSFNAWSCARHLTKRRSLDVAFSLFQECQSQATHGHGNACSKLSSVRVDLYRIVVLSCTLVAYYCATCYGCACSHVFRPNYWKIGIADMGREKLPGNAQVERYE